MTNAYRVNDCTLLSRSGKYQINGETGTWRFSYEEFAGRRTYYYFWRYDTRDPNRRVMRKLSGEKVHQKVSEITTQPRIVPINLSQFEAFRGE